MPEITFILEIERFTIRQLTRNDTGFIMELVNTPDGKEELILFGN